MTFTKSRLSLGGTTLLELLVYAALMLLLFTGIFGIFIASVKYYNSANVSIKVQQSAMEATYRLSRELSESNLASVKLFASPKGIVFMSPRTSTGAIAHNTTSGYEGKITWNSYICYYLEADAEESTKYQLVRKAVGVASTNDPVSSTTYDTAYFATGGGASIQGQTLSHRIDSLALYWMSGTSPVYTGTPAANPIYLGIVTKQVNPNGNDESVQTSDAIWVGN